MAPRCAKTRLPLLVLAPMLLSLGACRDRAISLSPENGIKYEDQVVGAGAPVVEGSQVRAHYVVRLPDGEVVVNTRTAGTGDPHEWVVGSETIIPGMNRAVIGMKMGGVRKAVLPPRAAYGKNGYAGKIPPNTDLIVYIELESTSR